MIKAQCCITVRKARPDASDGLSWVEARDAGGRRARSKREDHHMAFEFRCQTCDEIHKGMPGFGADAPLSYYMIPEAERASRCDLGSDDCVIDQDFFCARLPGNPGARRG